MQARLNRLINERTHMVGAIAHDLRTPLARLAFRLDSAPASLREKAITDIEEMKAMISAALDFIRDHSRPGAREMLDFRLLVESVADDLSDTGHEVSFEPGNSVPLSGDPLALRRMVTNLVENALEYGTRARLSLQRTGSNTCRLWIDDDGPGIDPAQREQLFMPFFRGEASRNRETGGIGLGLSAAHNIVLRMAVRLPWTTARKADFASRYCCRAHWKRKVSNVDSDRQNPLLDLCRDATTQAN